VAHYAAIAVPERLAEKLNNETTLQSDDWIVEKLKETFVEVDAEAPPRAALLGGSTASVTLRRGNRLFIANTGDSRTIVVSVSGDDEEVVYTSRKDKPHLADEHERITKSGGKVHVPPQNPMLSRVVVYSEAAHDLIGLAMSRSIGDWEWGVVGVTAEPLVHVLSVDNLTTDNAFVLAASDGLWDARRPQFVAKHFANSFYRHGKSPLAACHDMIQKASPVNENVYRDDITLAVIKIDDVM
jgi:serine/threonine protein phosphatase PrpC